MAKTKISEFSTTAGNNTDINSINIAEGCAPSGINDAIRELMRQLKEFQTGGAGDSVNSGGDFSVATNKFTVASASGNTAVAGTLAVTGTTTLTGALVANGNATLGDGSGDTVTVKGTPTLEVNPTLSGGTANGVLYLNGSKVATSGSALVFDGTNLGLGTSSPSAIGAGYPTLDIRGSTGGGQRWGNSTDSAYIYSNSNETNLATATNKPLLFSINASEAMRLTSTGLGIGTSSPSQKLDVAGAVALTGTTGASTAKTIFGTSTYLQFNAGSSGFSWNNSNNTVGLMLLDSSGNLGLGVTPSAWSGFKAFQIGAAGSVQAASDNSLRLSYNSYYDGAAYKRIGSGYANYFICDTDSAFTWLQAGTSTADSTITWNTSMTLNASGNLGVGTTSPNISGVAKALTIDGSDAILEIANSGTARATLYGNSSGAAFSGIGSAGIRFFTSSSGATTERARIDSSGSFYIGSTSTVNNARLSVTGDSTASLNSTLGVYTAATSFGGQFFYLKVETAAGTGFNLIQANNSGGECFKVAGNGNVANTNNSYGSLSDVKLKENIVDAAPKLADLMQVKVRNYNLKSYPEQKQLGVIAQELEQVFPSMVEESPDRDAEGNDLGTTTKSVKYSVFVPMLIKAMQEQQAQIESLRKRLADAGIA